MPRKRRGKSKPKDPVAAAGAGSGADTDSSAHDGHAQEEQDTKGRGRYSITGWIQDFWEEGVGWGSMNVAECMRTECTIFFCHARFTVCMPVQ